MPNALENLCEAIAYPDPLPDGATSYRLLVDGGEVVARLLGNRLVLSRELSRLEEHLPKLASYAAGRLLKEETVLAWDEQAGACIIWQDCAVGASSVQLLRFFKNFLASCDWWLARVTEFTEEHVSPPAMVILP